MRFSRAAALLLLLACGLAALPLPANAQGGTLLRVFDPRPERPWRRLSAADSLLLERVVLPMARRRWQGTNDECREGFQVEDAAAGAFTRPGARQKAFLYEYCQPSRIEEMDGVAVVEDGRVVAHVFLEGAGWGIFAGPDVDRNGISEILLTDGSTNQGVSWMSVSVVEIGRGGGLRSFGTFFVSEDDCGTLRDHPRHHVRVLYVRPGRRPRFFQQRYVGTCDPPQRWTKEGGLEPVEPEDGRSSP